MKPTTGVRLATSLLQWKCGKGAETRLRRRRWRASLVAAVTGGALALAPLPAAANGRFPAANEIVFAPNDPNLVVLRTSFAILPSHDNGATWNFLCEDAIGIGTTALVDPSLAITANGSLVVGAPLGLSVSSDVGCNWSCKGGGLASQNIIDTAVRPDTPASVVAITGTYVVQPDSDQEITHSQVFETTDDGLTWQAIGNPIDPDVVVTTIDVTKSDTSRLYVSGTRGYGSGKTASLFVSKDKGQTWAEWPMPAGAFDPNMEDAIFVAGVDPLDADRLYLRSSALATGGTSRLTTVTLSADGTPSFTTAHIFAVNPGILAITGEMLGFALSEDGSKIYIGSQEDGLWVGTAANLIFQKTSSIPVQCLATRGAELWACSAAVAGFVAGMSIDDGKTFVAKLPLIGDLTGPVACAPAQGGAACGEDANASQCGASYASFCEYYTCRAADASSPDSSANGLTSALPPRHDAGVSARDDAGAASPSCDLAVAGGSACTGVGAIFTLIGIAFGRRRKAR